MSLSKFGIDLDFIVNDMSGVETAVEHCCVCDRNSPDCFKCGVRMSILRAIGKHAAGERSTWLAYT
jgi:hypothetical protein